ncbi:hypothetical protein SAMN05421755_10472 [Nitrosomonas sp. Nm33]|nr:hypothetical protein SAMN05421755_10472 [Nitrosomonas sp. Nm33]
MGGKVSIAERGLMPPYPKVEGIEMIVGKLSTGLEGICFFLSM